ncbi:MAG: ATP-binding protein [Caldisericia bacterium]
MKQVVILSGKGGTGKTSLAAAFAAIEKNCIVVDCDVDAPDLHILMKPKVIKTKDFYGLKLASIDKNKCVQCGSCINNCRFEAISDDYIVDPVSCEGCGVCSLVCPANAITYIDKKAGEIYISETKYGPMVHALLIPGEENSGKLVTMTRFSANMVAYEEKKDFIIIDGAPGIGCPVISSVSNTNFAIVITEPTESGLHDLKRVIELIDNFNSKPFVIINKFDINNEKTLEIKNYCESKNISVLGEIPFDIIFIKAMLEGANIIDYSPESEISLLIRKIWSKFKKLTEKN